MVRDEDRR